MSDSQMPSRDRAGSSRTLDPNGSMPASPMSTPAPPGSTCTVGPWYIRDLEEDSSYMMQSKRISLPETVLSAALMDPLSRTCSITLQRSAAGQYSGFDPRLTLPGNSRRSRMSWLRMKSLVDEPASDRSRPRNQSTTIPSYFRISKGFV